MKKKLILIFLVITGSAVLSAQSLSPTVVASAGGYATGGDYSLSWTLGEVAVTTLTGANFILTQGFQQPWELDIGNAIDNPAYDWSIQTYPNPVHDLLRLKFSVDKTMDYDVEITDLTGKKVNIERFKNVGPGYEMEVDFTAYPQGIYLLKITSTDRKYIRTVKVQKY